MATFECKKFLLSDWDPERIGDPIYSTLALDDISCSLLDWDKLLLRLNSPKWWLFLPTVQSSELATVGTLSLVCRSFNFSSCFNHGLLYR